MHATKDKVNFRSTASFGNNVIGTLFLSQKVAITGDQRGDRWLPAEAKIEGISRTGFVSKNVLREPLSNPRENLISNCVEEWIRFKRGAGKENIEPYAQFVGEMWQSIGMDLDGYDREMPWSAAFISFVVRKTGGYQGFRYAAAHARYIHEAIRMKIDGNDHPFWGHRIDEHKVQIGDMVCRWRQNRIDYDYASSTKWFKSHCDIVVAVEDDSVFTIGGNVNHTVRHTRYPINSQGFLRNEGNVFAVLENRR